MAIFCAAAWLTGLLLSSSWRTERIKIKVRNSWAKITLSGQSCIFIKSLTAGTAAAWEEQKQSFGIVQPARANLPPLAWHTHTQAHTHINIQRVVSLQGRQKKAERAWNTPRTCVHHLDPFFIERQPSVIWAAWCIVKISDSHKHSTVANCKLLQIEVREFLGCSEILFI